MKIYVLLHFEHKNDFTMIILRLVALYKRLTMIMTSFYVQNVME